MIFKYRWVPEPETKLNPQTQVRKGLRDLRTGVGREVEGQRVREDLRSVL